MKFETKYNVGDQIWGMLHNKPHLFTIQRIKIGTNYGTSEAHYSETYYLDNIAQRVLKEDLEKYFFATKEKLVMPLLE